MHLSWQYSYANVQKQIHCVTSELEDATLVYNDCNETYQEYQNKVRDGLLRKTVYVVGKLNDLKYDVRAAMEHVLTARDMLLVLKKQKIEMDAYKLIVLQLAIAKNMPAHLGFLLLSYMF